MIMRDIRRPVLGRCVGFSLLAVLAMTAQLLTTWTGHEARWSFLLGAIYVMALWSLFAAIAEARRSRRFMAEVRVYVVKILGPERGAEARETAWQAYVEAPALIRRVMEASTNRGDGGVFKVLPGHFDGGLDG